MATEETEGKPAKSGGSKTLLIMVGGLVLVLLSVGSSYFMMQQMSKQIAAQVGNGNGGEQQKPNEPPKPALYQNLDPTFVINYDVQGHTRYLQVGMAVMTHDPKVVEDVKTHLPFIRNNLVILLSSQSFSGLSTRPGKEKLLEDALAEVQKILEERTGAPGVEAIYFTSFVTQ